MADLDVETTIKPVFTVDTQPHSRHSSDIGEPTEISRCLSKLERIMEAIASHVGLLEPDAQHAEETQMSHTDNQVQEGRSQDGFSDEDFAHPNSDLAGNSISHRGKRTLPEEVLDSESSKKQKLSEFRKILIVIKNQINSNFIILLQTRHQSGLFQNILTST